MPGRAVTIILLALIPLNLIADEPTDEELEQWLESDAPEPGYVDRSAGAELKIIAAITDETIPSSQTKITITPESISSGWVAIRQCHENLDPVPNAEVVYYFRAMRGLNITEARNIEQSWVEGQTVQLSNVERLSRLCIEAEAQVLYREKDGSYLLRYGPFQRKFLDGYFPYHVTLDVNYPDKLLAVYHLEPAPDRGYSIEIRQGMLSADTWFTGRLIFEYRFEKRY